MAELITKDQVIDWFRCYGHMDKPIPYDVLVTDIQAMDTVDAATAQQWIPLTESPKGRGCYIVAVNHWLDSKPVTREAYWNGCDWLSCDKKLELTPRVTHWMPLPEPPREGLENETL